MKHLIARLRLSRSAFTLTELLVVIAIMAIIMAITIPSFQGIGRGTAMRTGIVELKTTLGLARQWAITHRQTTYVVFVPLYDSYNNINSDLYKVYKAYSVFAVTNQTGGNNSGYYVKDWTFLPPGVVFDSQAFPTKNVFRNACTVNLPIASSGGAAKTLQAVGFSPEGGGSFGYTEVLLREGWANVSTNPWSLDYGLQMASSNRGVAVYTITGGLKVMDYSMP